MTSGMFSTTLTTRHSIGSLWHDWRWDQRLPQVLDHALFAAVVLAPFAWGGRGDGAVAVYAAAVVMALVAWLADASIGRRQQLLSSPLLILPSLAAVWLALQLTPLPAGLAGWLSPGVQEYLTARHDAPQLEGLGCGPWRTLSLHPSAGQISLAVLLCHFMLLFVGLQRIRCLADIQKIMKWLALGAVAMSAFGLLQYFTANGLFFWVFEHPFRRSNDFVCGSFINRNHFASFLAVGAMAIVYQLARLEPKPKPLRRPAATEVRDYTATAWAMGLAIVLLALLMSASRGGLLAAIAGTLVMAAIYWRRRVWGGKQLAYLLLSLVLLGIGLSVSSEDRLTERFEDLTSGSIESLDQLGGRRAIWMANVRAFAAFWLTGTGAGTHQDVYPLFLSQSFPKVFTHAESGYLQIATELGLPGILLLCGTFAYLVRWTLAAWKKTGSRDESACLGAVMAGISVSAVHSVYDFVWYIPATMAIALVLVLILRRLAHGDEAKTATAAQPPRVPLELAVVCAAAISYVVVVLAPPALASPAWNRYLACSARLDMAQQPGYESFADSGDPTGLNGGMAILEAEIAALRDALRRNPRSAAAHLRLARAYLQWFDAGSESRESRMNLGQLQGVVATNGFESADAVRRWLSSAIGSDRHLLEAAQRHAAEAVRLSPLEALGYVCLANLDFLDNRTGAASYPLLDQAASLAPHDGTVLFEIGKHYLVNGELPSAIEYWARCYEHPGRHRLLVIAALAGRIPASDFLATFTPDWTTLRSVWQRYLAAAKPDELEVLLAYARDATAAYHQGPRDVPVAYVWQWLGQMNGEAGHRDEQIACLERAMQENPNYVSVRRAYAVALFQAERYAEAEPHLRWCVARDPSNPGLRTCLHRAATLRHRSAPMQTAAPSALRSVR